MKKILIFKYEIYCNLKSIVWGDKHDRQ